jgi:hypothetical protein
MRRFDKLVSWTRPKGEEGWGEGTCLQPLPLVQHGGTAHPEMVRASPDPRLVMCVAPAFWPALFGHGISLGQITIAPGVVQILEYGIGFRLVERQVDESEVVGLGEALETETVEHIEPPGGTG